MTTATWLDRLPRSSIRLGERTWPAHRLFAVTGSVVAVGVFLALAMARDQDVAPALSTVAATITLGLVWVRLRAWLSGGEAWVLLEHVVLGLGICSVVSWQMGIPMAVVVDPITVSVSVGFAFGRCGCLVHGCCYGVACRTGVVYPPECHRHGPPTRRLPVQAIEALLWLVLAGVGAVLLFAAPAGSTTLTVVAVYAWGRFALDGLRADPRPHLLGLSESRWLCLGLLGGVLGLRVWGRTDAALWPIAITAALLAVTVLSWRLLVVPTATTGELDPELRAAALTLARRVREPGVHVADVGPLVAAASWTDGRLCLSIRGEHRAIGAGEAELALAAMLRTMGLPDDLARLTRSPGGLYAIDVPVASLGPAPAG